MKTLYIFLMTLYFQQNYLRLYFHNQF